MSDRRSQVSATGMDQSGSWHGGDPGDARSRPRCAVAADRDDEEVDACVLVLTRMVRHLVDVN